jgi:hypothetical protein
MTRGSGEPTLKTLSRSEHALGEAPTHQTIDPLEEKVFGLQLEICRLRRWLLRAACGLGGLVLLIAVVASFTHRNEPVKPDPVTAELRIHRLILVAEDGSERARLALNAESQPVLEFLDVRGGRRIVLGSVGEKRGITFFDEKKRERGYLGMTSNGTPLVELSDPGRKGWARMLVSQTGLPAVLVGNDGNPSVGLAASEKDRKGATLFVQDANKKVRVLLGMDQNSQPTLTFLDGSGKEQPKERKK